MQAKPHPFLATDKWPKVDKKINDADTKFPYLIENEVETYFAEFELNAE